MSGAPNPTYVWPLCLRDGFLLQRTNVHQQKLVAVN